MSAKTKADAMSFSDAGATMLLLLDWSPPEGLTVTVSGTSVPGRNAESVVHVVLSARPDQMCVINVGKVPDEAAMVVLTQIGHLLLAAATDETEELIPRLAIEYLGKKTP